ncbi:MAG: zinc ribbon domain-containing protein [Actinobacteria bacterium]|nr:zinc ribbon domain-containing protein [Actinomycetota bacterium]
MLVECKTCGKEIAKGVKKCVHCGANQRNFFLRHKILTGLMAIVALVVVVAALGGGDEQPGDTGTELPEYRVVSVEDFTFFGGPRYVYHVVVSTEASKAELEAIANEVIAQAQDETPFNAVSVAFYDYEEYVGHGLTPLGRVTPAPEGDWAKADQVNTGDYSAMSIKSEVRDVDWSKRLTQAEVEVWKAWRDEHRVRAAALDPEDIYAVVDEDLLSSDIAKQYDMAVDEVDAIMMKHSLNWRF